jgi:hypothetical protein
MEHCSTINFLVHVNQCYNDGCVVTSWFAVHGTSMNNTNGLISGDNKGYAEFLMEQYMNGNGSIPGQVCSLCFNSNILRCKFTCNMYRDHSLLHLLKAIWVMSLLILVVPFVLTLDCLVTTTIVHAMARYYE